MVVRVVAPPQLVAVARDRRQVLVSAREAGDVVAGLVERVVRVRDLDRPVVELLHEEVLELEAHLELEALLLRARHDPAEDRARAVRPRLALDRHVAREPREVGLPGDRRVALQGRDRRDVRVARHLADLAGREPGKAGALLDQAVECIARADRDELRARTRVHVDELREHELDTARLHVLPDRIRRSRPSHGSSSSDVGRIGLPGRDRRVKVRVPHLRRRDVCVFAAGRSSVSVRRLRAPAAASPSSLRSRWRASRRGAGRDPTTRRFGAAAGEACSDGRTAPRRCR